MLRSAQQPYSALTPRSAQQPCLPAVIRGLLAAFALATLQGAETGTDPATDPSTTTSAAAVPVVAAAAVQSVATAKPAPRIMPVVSQTAPENGLALFGPGIWVSPGTEVVFSGRLVFDQGPEDGLEVVAALKASKLHETLTELDTADALRVLTALIVAFGEPRDGVPPDSLSNLPPRGGPVDITLVWRTPSGSWNAIPVTSAIRDRHTDRAMVMVPGVYTGGALGTYQLPDGSGRVHQAPVLTQAGAVCALYDEENGSPLALAVPVPAEDKRWEANSAILPPVSTPIRLVVTRARALRAFAAADLQGPDFAAWFAGNPLGQPASAVVQVSANQPRETDRELQIRMLALAEQRGAQFVPVFQTIGGSEPAAR